MYFINPELQPQTYLCTFVGVHVHGRKEGEMDTSHSALDLMDFPPHIWFQNLLEA